MPRRKKVPELVVDSCAGCMHKAEYEEIKAVRGMHSCPFSSRYTPKCSDGGYIFIPQTPEGIAKYATTRAKQRLGLTEGEDDDDRGT